MEDLTNPAEEPAAEDPKASAKAEKARAREEKKAAAEEAKRARAEEKARLKAMTKEEKKGAVEEAKRARAEEKASARAARKAAPKAARGKGKSERIISMSIEGTDVRVVYSSGISIESWDSVAFDPQILKVGQIADPDGLGGVIRSALEGRDVGKSRVVCAMPGLRSVSRVMSMPRVGKKELPTVIPREVNKLMTVSEEDNYLHWQELPSETDQMQIFVLAIPKDPLLTFMEALRIAGLTPIAIDLKPLALVRAVNQKDAIIATGESNSMELVIVVDDIPVLIRSVFLGEGVVTQDYAVGRISDELGRTILTYNEINKDNPLDPEIPIYLTGAAAGGVPFALNVAALTGRTVQPLEPPVVYPEGFPIADFMVNVGLILKVV
jgi:type IV pilus assembly protein PilM